MLKKDQAGLTGIKLKIKMGFHVFLRYTLLIVTTLKSYCFNTHDEVYSACIYVNFLISDNIN